jgi:NADH-quinone oxidoreductase subunit E
MDIGRSMDIGGSMEVKKREEVLTPYKDEPSGIIPALQDLQAEFGYISKENLRAAAENCGVPFSYAYSIATFYRSFSLKERGRYVIKVCDGTACHLRMSSELMAELENSLGIGPGETTEDKLFSIETVNCLGACAMAPVVSINNELYGYLTRTKLRGLIEDLADQANTRETSAGKGNSDRSKEAIS